VCWINTWQTLTWSIGWSSNKSFNICKVHCKWNYNSVQHHPRNCLDIVMRIGVVMLKIGGPP
jgi:hypothetical protein